MLKVLSVDWDYFLPELGWYDWSHTEESGMFYEFVWNTRCASRNLKTGQRALENVIPNPDLLNGFWDRVLASNATPIICVSESHKDLYHFIGTICNMKIWNFDQHHDLGYEQMKTIACDNWAGKLIKSGICTQYNLIYPSWRKQDNDEAKPMVKENVNIRYSHSKPIKADVVFVCRSSCWSPTWNDNAWTTFIHGLRDRCRFGWDMAVEQGWIHKYVMKERHPNMKEAAQLADQYEALYTQIQQKNEAILKENSK